MMRYLVFVIIFCSTFAAQAQRNYLNVSAGLQTYNQVGKLGVVSVGTAINAPAVVTSSTAIGSRPIFGFQYAHLQTGGNVFKLGLQYAESTYIINQLEFTRATDGSITLGDVFEPVGTAQSYFVQVATDFGVPLFKNGTNWQFYAAGRAGAQFEGYYQMTDIATVFPSEMEAISLSVAVSPELAYTFANEKVRIGFNPVLQFFRMGTERERIGDPNLNQQERTSSGFGLELFGNQVINYDLRVGFLL
ncbi:MAG: hypothetical protein AB8G22_16295 [Saprospiraceae bacterium]